VLKGPLAPLNELTSPIMRIPGGLEQAFEWMLNPEVDAIGQYTMFTLAPFGRMSRDVYRAINNPSMATEFMFGIPWSRLQAFQNERRARE
jgi:hypothetical protein